ncbi:MAG TPA: response regulator, partial [Mycobacteriales bacterium]
MGTRLLVVEDDDRIRAVLRLALEDEGYDIDEAPGAEIALERIRTNPPDMMIVDLMLGEMDGYTCIREVRRGSDIPIIVVSARADTHDIVAGLEAGADDYVTKPFQVKEITARLRALRRRTRTSADAEAPPDLVLDPDPQQP